MGHWSRLTFKPDVISASLGIADPVFSIPQKHLVKYDVEGAEELGKASKTEVVLDPQGCCLADIGEYYFEGTMEQALDCSETVRSTTNVWMTDFR